MRARSPLPVDPLTPAELSSWHLCTGYAYNRDGITENVVTVLCEFDTPVPDERVVAAIARLTEVTPNLRTRIVSGMDGPVRIVHEPGAVPCPEIRRRTLAPADDVRTLFAVRTPLPVDPRSTAAGYTLYDNGSGVVAVIVDIHHIFCDHGGALALRSHLRSIVDGGDGPDPATAADVRAAKYGRSDVLDRNLQHWHQVLAGAPRAITYRAMPRQDEDLVRSVERDLPTALLDRVASAATHLAVTPYAMWVGALSAMISRYTGQESLVAQTTLANRTRAEASVVANFAQIVYVPVDGAPTDSLGHRARTAARALLLAMRHGVYDWQALMTWLRSEQQRRGVAFRPAFNLNYGGELHEFKESSGAHEHWDPRLDRALPGCDLNIRVTGRRVAVEARRPVWSAREPHLVLDDLVTVLDRLCAEPDLPVSECGVARLDGVGDLIFGHRSGVGVHLPMVERLLRSVTGVTEATARAVVSDGETRIAATVRVDPAEQTMLLDRCWDAQRRTSGGVVPDTIEVVA